MMLQNSTRDSICKSILKHQFQKVAIQCPDSILQHVSEIVRQFEESVNRIIMLKEDKNSCIKKPLFVILADTASGSSCCLDIVAAKHYSADCIIHLGSACLTKPNEPFFFFHFFSEFPFNLKKFTQALETFQKDPCLFSKYSLLESIVLVYEVEYHHCLQDIVKVLLKYFSQSLYVAVAETEYNEFGYDYGFDEYLVGRMLHQVNRDCVNEKDFSITGNKNSTFLDSSNHPLQSNDKTFFVFLGDLNINNTSGLFRRFALRYGSSYKILGYEPLQESTTCQHSLTVFDLKENPSSLLPLCKLLTLRYGLIEKAKLAKMIGIIYTTVGGHYHLMVFNRLKRLCQANKKCIVSLLIGKMNNTKLENFPDIDIFCLISCPQSSFISNFRDYSKGILTPFELEVALNYREWSTDYIIENEELCRENSTAEPLWDSDQSSYMEETTTLKRVDPASLEETTTLKRVDPASLEETTTLKRVDPASLEETILNLYPIKNRTYQGVVFASSEDVNVYEGLSGVASGYTKEIAEDSREK